jgi:uncharacterized membrane protein YeaQ/YmgE (transglycosylase-associated protein family)
MIDFLIFVAVGAAAGWLAGVLFKGHGFGLLINLLVGVAGGFLGGWIFGKLGISFLGGIGQFVAAVVGAIILLWVISIFKRK